MLKIFKRHKRLASLEDYLGVFYVQDKWGDQEHKEDGDGWGAITQLKKDVKALQEAQKKGKK